MERKELKQLACDPSLIPLPGRSEGYSGEGNKVDDFVQSPCKYDKQTAVQID